MKRGGRESRERGWYVQGERGGIIRTGCVREIEGEGWKGGERMTVGR